MIKAILFDFDGVLIDSREATIKGFQETMRHFKLPIPQKKEFNGLLGLKTRDISGALQPSLDEDKINLLYGYYRKMALVHLKYVKIKPKAFDVLNQLSERYKLALVTSRGKIGITELFKKYSFKKYFSVVLDREDVKQHKPHPEGLIRAIEALGVESKESIYIGDTQVDVDAAHNAGMKCIIVHDTEKVENADFTAKDLLKILDVVCKMQ